MYRIHSSIFYLHSQQDRSLMFRKLPSEKIYPDYYAVIKKPMDLSKIRAKLKARSYTQLKEFKEDFKLIFRNAKEYNIPESQIYENAVILETTFKKLKKKLLSKTSVPKYQKDDSVFIDLGDSMWYKSIIVKVKKKPHKIVYRVKYGTASYTIVSESHIKVNSIIFEV
jgi:hypothetical protein